MADAAEEPTCLSAKQGGVDEVVPSADVAFNHDGEDKKKKEARKEKAASDIATSAAAALSAAAVKAKVGNCVKCQEFELRLFPEKCTSFLYNCISVRLFLCVCVCGYVTHTH